MSDKGALDIKNTKEPEAASAKDSALKPRRLGLDCEYDRELSRLQIELVKLQEWIRYKGSKVVIIFEGRDAAGEGGAIKRITQSLNPRVCRVVALGTPTEREKCTSNATCRTCPPLERWSFLIAAGTAAPASSE